MTGWVAVDVSDIASRWRPLTPSEDGIAPTLIEDAQDILEADLEEVGVEGAPIPLNARWERTYIRTVATMVRRLLINPEGYLKEESDGYRYERDKTLSAGALYVTTDELDRLRLKRRRRSTAFTIVPS